MNKLVFLSILLLGLVVISSCSKNVVDCGRDVTCFANNFRTCTPTKIYDGLVEVRGGTSKSCNVVLGYRTLRDALIPNTTLDDFKLTMECVVQNTNTFKDGDMMDLFRITERSLTCKGALYDRLHKLGLSVPYPDYCAFIPGYINCVSHKMEPNKVTLVILNNRSNTITVNSINVSGCNEKFNEILPSYTQKTFVIDGPPECNFGAPNDRFKGNILLHYNESNKAFRELLKLAVGGIFTNIE